MSLTVRITIHPHELHSTLDTLQQWSIQQDWLTTPNVMIIDLNIMADPSGLAQQHTGDRLVVSKPQPKSFSLMDHLVERAHV